jgi:Bacterial archaeo-eukaryotic release factor family 3
MDLLKPIPSNSEREQISNVQFHPFVSIVMPFTPVITLKKDLEYLLKSALSKIEANLIKNYPNDKAMPVIIKLKNLVRSLNYNTHKKSIAIFVSPVVEKVYYLDIFMEEKIVLDSSFKIRDLIQCKKADIEYLVLLLGSKVSKMYLGNNSKLVLIKSNSSNDQNHDNEKITDTRNSLAGVISNESSNRFLTQMDQGLSLVLDSYPLPLFTMGSQEVLANFKKITKNEKNIVQFIHGDYEEASVQEISRILEHFISRWDKVKQQHLLKQVEKAKTQNKLASGGQEVLVAARHNKGKLLVIEKNYKNNFNKSETYRSLFNTDFSSNNLFYIKDELDQIFEKVLECGGDVEFVEEGALKNYGDIVLIEI